MSFPAQRKKNVGKSNTLKGRVTWNPVTAALKGETITLAEENVSSCSVHQDFSLERKIPLLWPPSHWLCNFLDASSSQSCRSSQRFPSKANFHRPHQPLISTPTDWPSFLKFRPFAVLSMCTHILGAHAPTGPHTCAGSCVCTCL